MSWKHYNAEAKKIEVVRTLVGDMEQFGASQQKQLDRFITVHGRNSVNIC